MGIAGFFLWLQRWYEHCIDLIPDHVVESAQRGEVDLTETSLLKDILYVDMNGLIHPCCHDTKPLPEPENEEEMMERIFTQLDTLVKIVRPQKCLVLCIDGVAPRSKLNQQRSRRFRAADERMESDRLTSKVAKEITKKYGLPRPSIKKKWDHNVITPSTPFMERVAWNLEWFIIKKMNEDDFWKNLVVVFSDAHVPGEGEHKIMHYIRSLRAQPDYNPSTSHVIVGMDADLICLGLSTHEEHISILRNQLTETFQGDPDRFCYFDLHRYREQLKEDFGNIANGDFERIIDDFIFLCFFVGNDFLPHVPLISIKTKGIETLLDHYVRQFDAHGHLTYLGEVQFKNLSIFLRSFITECMDKVQKEYHGVMRAKERAKKNSEERCTAYEQNVEHLISSTDMDLQEKSDALLSVMVNLRKERKNLVVDSQPLKFSYLNKKFRNDYYEQKFGWEKGSADFESNISKLCGEYLRGMQWVMRYYTRGCPSWEWYFPFHYAPLLEDLAAFSGKVNVTMTLSKPLHPVEQLLAVLPRQSAHALPEVLQGPVLDEHSVLAKFYPKKVDVDFSEANFAYQGVLRIPFIDSEGLISARQSLADVEEDDGQSLVFVNEDHPAAKAMESIVSTLRKKSGDEHSKKTSKENFLPVSREVVQKVPIGGLFGLRQEELPEHQKMPCWDQGLRAYLKDKKSDKYDLRQFVKAIKTNKVRSYAFELDTNEEYNHELIAPLEDIPKTAQKEQKKASRSPQRSQTAKSKSSEGTSPTQKAAEKTTPKRKRSRSEREDSASASKRHNQG